MTWAELSASVAPESREAVSDRRVALGARGVWLDVGGVRACGLRP